MQKINQQSLTAIGIFHRSFRTACLNTLLLTVLWFSTGANAKEDWTCTDVASIKTDNVVLVCGVATAATEGEAREMALKRAKNEFDLVCQSSADCRDYETNIEPLRNTCSQGDDNQYKCYRGLRYIILAERKGAVPPPPVQAQEPEQVPEPMAKRPPPARSNPVPIFEVPPRPVSVGFGTFSLTLIRADLPDTSMDFAGGAFWFGYAFTKYIAARAALYSASNTKFIGEGADIDLAVSGRELQLLLGNNLDRKGFRIYLGLGRFSESWEDGGNQVESFNGSEYVFGLGYNFDRFTIEFTAAARDAAPYYQALKYQWIIKDYPDFLEDQLSVSSGSFNFQFRF
ncbi:MAG: hypothetical protein OEZ47_04700 [Gammaproteobacteria bacterium]|nr:hypothetical protein [Gammaproteobacteria bacterium]